MRLRLRVGWRSIHVIRRVVRRGRHPVIRRGAWRGMCVRLAHASRGPDARGGAGGGYTLSGCDVPACRSAKAVQIKKKG